MNYHECIVCGKLFEVGDQQGAKKFCSDKCRIPYQREKMRRYNRTRYLRDKDKLRLPDREITCKRCGNVFIGRSRQAYCPDCLHLDEYYMRQLREHRRDWV